MVKPLQHVHQRHLPPHGPLMRHALIPVRSASRMPRPLRWVAGMSLLGDSLMTRRIQPPLQENRTDIICRRLFVSECKNATRPDVRSEFGNGHTLRFYHFHTITLPRSYPSRGMTTPMPTRRAFGTPQAPRARQAWQSRRGRSSGPMIQSSLSPGELVRLQSRTYVWREDQEPHH